MHSIEKNEKVKQPITAAGCPVFDNQNVITAGPHGATAILSN